MAGEGDPIYYAVKVIKAAAALAILATLVTLPPPSAAQKYPEKNVRLVVPFPSGASQILGILGAEKLTEALGQPVVVDFRPGAGGTIGAEMAKIMNAPEVKRQLAKVEVEPVTSTPSEFAAMFKAEREKWARVIREANIRVE